MAQLAKTDRAFASGALRALHRGPAAEGMPWFAWRMAVVKDLPSRPNFGLADVAEHVGYGSASTFSSALAMTQLLSK